HQVKPHQQRSNTAPPPSRTPVTADNELLLLHTLEFQPVARPSGDVHAVAIFCDDTLPAFLARLSIVGFALRLPVLREPQRIPELERLPQHFLPVSERDLPGVMLAQIEQVEQI